MRSGSLEDVRAWLAQSPSLEEVRVAFPREWEVVQRDLAPVIARGDLDELKAYVLALGHPAGAGRTGSKHRERQLVAAAVRRWIVTEQLRRTALSAASGTRKGRVRFGLVNGYIAQRLLFKRDLERKPVSLRWFRVIWPLLRQRRLLMPLVGRKGIYCFYSRPLITRLAQMIGDRSCLEIAAGDGTLSRFLADAGVAITATDDHSWQHAVSFPEAVRRLEAVAALRAYQPQVVVCSWPPADNPFEREVFRTPSVQLYIVIGSRHAFASGNWAAYEEQEQFVFTEEPALGRLVVPPELESAVYVFRRKEVAS
jgi:hypothetical protein